MPSNLLWYPRHWIFGAYCPEFRERAAQQVELVGVVSGAVEDRVRPKGQVTDVVVGLPQRTHAPRGDQRSPRASPPSNLARYGRRLDAQFTKEAFTGREHLTQKLSGQPLTEHAVHIHVGSAFTISGIRIPTNHHAAYSEIVGNLGWSAEGNRIASGRREYRSDVTVTAIILGKHRSFIYWRTRGAPVRPHDLVSGGPYEDKSAY